MRFTSINYISVELYIAIDFKVSLTTATATMSLDSTPTAAYTTAATTPTVTTNTPSSDISTITCITSPVNLSSATPAHFSRDNFAHRLVGSPKEAVEIAMWELPAQGHPKLTLKVYDLVGDNTKATNAKVAWLSNFMERNLDCKN
jgi:hypothetical protein